MTATLYWPRRLLLAAMACTALVSGTATAQDFPNRPLTLIVGSAAGGALDVYTRKVADAMSRNINQQIVIVNRPGAAGDIGLSAGAKAAPDGYTFLVVGKYFTSNIYLQKPDYVPLRDFVAISQTVTYPMILSVNMQSPVKTAGEFFAQAKANPGKLNFGTAGAPGKMAMAQLANIAGVKFTEVPYRSDPEMFTDFLAGRIDAMMTASPTALSRIKAGNMRPLGVTSAKRFAALPDVPSLSEVLPAYSDAFWIGFIAPAGVPAPIVQFLYREIKKAGEDPSVDTWLRQTAGMEPTSTTPAEFTEFLKNDLIVNEKVIRENKIGN